MPGHAQREIPTLSNEFAPDFSESERFLNAFREETFQRIDRGKADLRDTLASRGLVRSGELEERLFLDVENPRLAQLETVAAQREEQFRQQQLQFLLAQFQGQLSVFNTQSNADLQIFLQQQKFEFDEEHGGSGSGSFFGSLAGGVAGSFLGPIGAAAGAKLGEKVF